MKRSFDDYERVARGLFGCSSIWLGKDHLLYIQGKGLLFPVTEEYRRFAYRDIEALTIAKTSGFLVGALLYALGVLLMGGTVGLMLASRSPGDTGVLLTALLIPFPLTLAFLFLLVRQFVLGKRCTCILQTEQRRVRLRPLSAMHRANETVQTIAPRILEAQHEIVELSEGEPLDVVSPPPGPPIAVRRLVPPAFGGMVVGGALLALLSVLASYPLSLATLLTLSATTLLLLVALTGAVRNPTPDSVRTLLWLVLGLVVVAGGTGIVYLFSVSLDNPAYTTDVDGIFRAFGDLGAAGAAAFPVIFGVLGGFLAALSVIGLLNALKWQRVLRAPSTP